MSLLIFDEVTDMPRGGDYVPGLTLVMQTPPSVAEENLETRGKDDLEKVMDVNLIRQRFINLRYRNRVRLLPPGHLDSMIAAKEWVDDYMLHASRGDYDGTTDIWTRSYDDWSKPYGS